MDGNSLSRDASVAFIRNWPVTLLSLCFFPLLLSLGNWQLNRAAEKQQIQDQINGRLSTQPINLTGRVPEPGTLSAYTPVRLLGFYSDEYFLLDNRTRNGRVGYEVLQVFETGSGDAAKVRWLINRGWLPASSHRSELPQVSYPLAAKVITGFLYPGSLEGQGLTNPHSRIQSPRQLSPEQLNVAQPAWQVRLSADSDTAFTTDWQLITSSPQKHTGYAVQWFTMAAALFVLWLLTASNLRQILREKWFKKTTEQT
ncbi:SURF1 family protein [Microbulbifer sp. ARAS458-1]